MKKYKIVKHYVSPIEHMFRIYKRENLFFWKWETSYSTIEKCQEMIAYWKACAIEQRAIIDNTPKAKVVAYYD